MHKTETSSSLSSAPPASAQEGPKVPHVELRPVGLAKPNRPVSAPPMQLIIPPQPPTSPPSATPPTAATLSPLVIIPGNGTAQKEKGLL